MTCNNSCCIMEIIRRYKSEFIHNFFTAECHFLIIFMTIKNDQEDRLDLVQRLIKIHRSDEITFPSTFSDAIIPLADSRYEPFMLHNADRSEIFIMHASTVHVDRRMNAANVCAKSMNNADFGLAFRARKKKKKKSLG